MIQYHATYIVAKVLISDRPTRSDGRPVEDRTTTIGVDSITPPANWQRAPNISFKLILVWSAVLERCAAVGSGGLGLAPSGMPRHAAHARAKQQVPRMPRMLGQAVRWCPRKVAIHAKQIP